MVTGILDVGDQDPAAERNSPIAAEQDEDTAFLRQEVPGEAVCWFNDVAYAHGSLVKSGTGILCCERGIWIEAGPADAENP